MMRSLYSGVSGLKVHQTKMDVIGNNISNVNTVGFKASQVNFSDILYQTTSSASGPNANTGRAGTNAKQIGLGASVAEITTTVAVSGGAQRTDNALDVMIEGEQYFIVNNGQQNLFTKAGAFKVDANGVLCNSSGCKVMGWQVDPNDENKTVPDRVSELRVMSPDNLYTPPEATTNTYMTGNIDYKDTQLQTDTGKSTTMSFYDNLGQSYMAVMNIKQSEENYNVYNVTITDILDSQGNSIFVRKTVEDDGSITYSASDITSFMWGAEGEEYTAEVDEEDGSVRIEMEGVPLTFSQETGKFVSVGANEENPNSVFFSVTGLDPSPFQTIDVDFSKMTMYASSGSSSFANSRGSVDDPSKGTGKPQGNMTGISVDTSGRIYGAYDNGDTMLLCQIAVASFANAAGLEAAGNNLFRTTMNSGEFDGVGEDVTLAGGKMTTGVLEMSNVDLSSEFTQMITTQRGFQANSRIITVSDTLLEELINLKR
ncbi:MAG: flagellar hook-basal body complex protein [Lachnospiraceae bacterium]|nr:flagellar hook-basal body complex protein [Lachnospiraceae bacterium]